MTHIRLVELSDSTRALLARARDMAEPSALERRRVLSALERELADRRGQLRGGPTQKS